MSSITTVKLSGLTCEACEKISTKKLSKIAGVTEVSSLGDKSTFVITADNKITNEEVEQALKDTSYAVVALN